TASEVPATTRSTWVSVVRKPTRDEMTDTQLDLAVAGTSDAALGVAPEATELNEDIMLGAVMVGYRHFQPVINAITALAEKTANRLGAVVAGTSDAVLMVESEAKELNEDIMLGAVMFGHRHFQPVINAIIELAEKAAKEPRDVAIIDNSAIEKEMLGIAEQD